MRKRGQKMRGPLVREKTGETAADRHQPPTGRAINASRRYRPLTQAVNRNRRQYKLLTEIVNKSR